MQSAAQVAQLHGKLWRGPSGSRVSFSLLGLQDFALQSLSHVTASGKDMLRINRNNFLESF